MASYSSLKTDTAEQVALERWREAQRKHAKRRKGGTHDVPRLRSFRTVTRHMCAKVRPQAMSFTDSVLVAACMYKINDQKVSL